MARVVLTINRLRVLHPEEGWNAERPDSLFDVELLSNIGDEDVARIMGLIGPVTTIYTRRARAIADPPPGYAGSAVMFTVLGFGLGLIWCYGITPDMPELKLKVTEIMESLTVNGLKVAEIAALNKIRQVLGV